MKTFSFAVLLFIFWVLLSGHFSPLLLGLGVASVVLTVLLATRMNVIDHESYPVHLSSQKPAFLFYLMREIVLANIDVIKRILRKGGKDISPQLIELPVPQQTDLAKVIYANSITLTPGTVSISLENDKVLVHTLSKESADDLLAGNMAKQIPDLQAKK